MRLLVVGATGTVGRELTRAASAEGHDVVAMSRNRVLLDVLGTTVGCETVQLDLLDGVRVLPDADAIIDLSWPNRRLPRQVVGAAEAAVGAVDSWLGLHPGAVAVHAGTFVVAGAARPPPSRLLDKLAWDDPYALAKSAGERAIGRARHRDRVSVVRLGTVLTDDSAWGTLILRALAYGSVANPGALDTAANLCTVRPLLRAAQYPVPLAGATAAAAVTWGTVIARTAAMAGCAFHAESSPVGAAPLVPPGLLSRLPRQALWLAPARLSKVRPWQVWPLLRPARAVQRATMGYRGAGTVAPPMLPIAPPMPGGGHDIAELEAALASLAQAYRSRGWAPPASTEI